MWWIVKGLLKLKETYNVVPDMRDGSIVGQVGSYEHTSLKNNTVYRCICNQCLKFYVYIDF